jgi:hypothetical protein
MDATALKKQIQDALSRHVAGDGDGLLFLGNPQDPIPRLLIRDPVLDATEVRVWMMLRTEVENARMSAAFPDQKRLARSVGCSKPTLVRALRHLRALRWITVFPLPRHGKHGGNGRNRGNAYLLHDEPLDLAASLQIDPHYLAFIRKGAGSKQGRSQRICEAVLRSIDQEVEMGRDITVSRPATRILSARMNSLRSRPDPSLVQVHPVTSLSKSRVKNFNSGPEKARVKIFNSGPTSTVRSSSNKKILTTQEVSSKQPRAREGQVHWHACLTESQRSILAPYLDALPAKYRQDVLDEFTGKYLRKRKEGRPIDSIAGYMNSLCQRARDGHPEPFRLTQDGRRIAKERSGGTGAGTNGPGADRQVVNPRTSSKEDKELWSKCLDALAGALPADEISTYLRPVVPVRIGRNIDLLVPNRFVKDQVIERLDQIRAALSRLLGSVPRVRVEIGGGAV